MPEKRYQVFVSSTFVDLEEERQEVMHALLELDCIPSGMELFPAANETQWSLIQRVISDCDYYILIIGGRYGSIAPDGFSYTEKEFQYAASIGKPIIVFLHKDPGKIVAEKTEKTEEGKKKLAAFRAIVEEKHLCKHWNSAYELGSVVSRSVVRLIKTTPAVGWLRADEIASQEANNEIIRLTKEVELLKKQLARDRQKPPPGTETLAQGQDEFEFYYYFTAKNPKSYERKQFQTSASATWNQIFSVIGALMIHEATEAYLKKVLDKWISESFLKDFLQKSKQLKDYSLMIPAAIVLNDFQTIKIQLRALGLIHQNDRPRSVKDNETYWSLTPYGDEVLTRLRAIKKDSIR